MAKSALIFWGGWEGHTPERSASIVADMLRSHDVVVRVEKGTSVLASAELQAFDLIIPMVTMSVIEKAELQALLAAIKSGTGLAGFHGAMGDSFRNEPDYQFMTGGQWVAHPGNIINYRVTITKPDEPVMAGITDFDYRSEQYYMHVDPGNEVLATTTFTDEHFPEIGGTIMPVVWRRRYGRGRVFYSALGHTAEEFSLQSMRTIFERGALWALRQP